MRQFYYIAASQFLAPSAGLQILSDNILESKSGAAERQGPSDEEYEELFDAVLKSQRDDDALYNRVREFFDRDGANVNHETNYCDNILRVALFPIVRFQIDDRDVQPPKLSLFTRLLQEKSSAEHAESDDVSYKYEFDAKVLASALPFRRAGLGLRFASWNADSQWADIVRLLLIRGADPSLWPKHNLAMLASSSRWKSLKLLVEHPSVTAQPVDVFRPVMNALGRAYLNDGVPDEFFDVFVLLFSLGCNRTDILDMMLAAVEDDINFADLDGEEMIRLKQIFANASAAEPLQDDAVSQINSTLCPALPLRLKMLKMIFLTRGQNAYDRAKAFCDHIFETKWRTNGHKFSLPYCVVEHCINDVKRRKSEFAKLMYNKRLSVCSWNYFDCAAARRIFQFAFPDDANRELLLGLSQRVVFPARPLIGSPAVDESEGRK